MLEYHVRGPGFSAYVEADNEFSAVWEAIKSGDLPSFADPVRVTVVEMDEDGPVGEGCAFRVSAVVEEDDDDE